MEKCERCNRSELPTRNFEVPGGRQQRLCTSCEAKVVATHGEDYLTYVRGSADDGVAFGDLSPQDEGGEPPVLTPPAADADVDSDASAE